MDLVFCLFIQLFATAVFLLAIDWPRTVERHHGEMKKPMYAGLSRPRGRLARECARLYRRRGF